MVANILSVCSTVVAFVHGTKQIYRNFGLTSNFPNIRKTRNGAELLLSVRFLFENRLLISLIFFAFSSVFSQTDYVSVFFQRKVFQTSFFRVIFCVQFGKFNSTSFTKSFFYVFGFCEQFGSFYFFSVLCFRKYYSIKIQKKSSVTRIVFYKLRFFLRKFSALEFGFSFFFQIQ